MPDIGIITTAGVNDSDRIVAWYRTHSVLRTEPGGQRLHVIREKPRSAICRCGAALKVKER